MTSHTIKQILAAVLLGALATLGARADAPTNGKSVYAGSCTGCHGSSPLTSNMSKIYNGRNARSVIDTAIANNTGGMGFLRAGLPSGGSGLADLAAYLGNTPAALSFGSTEVGSTATAQTVTISASLKAGKSISGLSVATTGDFARSGGTCATSVATGQSCSVLVSFTPTAAGARSGTLSITHSQTLTPITIALNGSGAAVAAPVANITPTTLTMPATAIGATSAAQNVNVANSGTAALALSSIKLSSAADFVIAGGTCAAGASVAPGASCTVSVAFKPGAGATGTRSANLSIAHNAPASPGVVSLSGSATAAPAPIAGLTASLRFGNIDLGASSTTQTATLSNSGTAALVIATIATDSSDFVVKGGSCTAGASIAPAASCTIGVAFTPKAAGARSGSLIVTHNASGGRSSASLSGTGLALTPVISVSPTALGFSQTVGTPSAPQTASVSNTGKAPLLINTLTLGGAQAAEFSLDGASTCTAGASVAVGASCVVKLVFTAGAIGTRSASLSIANNASTTATTITLTGIGSATPQPAISLSASTLSFVEQTIATTSAAQSVTVSNSGSALLSLNSITLTGTAASEFTRGGSCTPTTTLAAGANCTLTLSFTPRALGSRTATLTLLSDASNGAAVLSLSGTGAAVPAPAVALTPGSLEFGNQTIGVASTAHAVTLANTGSGALSLSGISATSGFGVTHNCGASVAAGARCTLSVVFTPAAAGKATGSLSVVSNAAGSPHKLNFSGAGVVASPALAWTPATTALDFGDTSVGAASTTKALTLSNQGPGAITLSQISIAGPNAADFHLGSAGTCTPTSTLAQGAACTIAMAFQPGAAGPRTATLHIASTGTSPPDVTLSGNGSALALPGLAVTPAALSFNVAAEAQTVEPQTVTIQSTGSAVLRVTAIRIAAGSFTIATATAGGCAAAPFDLMPGESCAFDVGWSSTDTGSETGMVEIDTDAATAPTQVAIQAVRADDEAPEISNVGAGGCSLASGDSLADPTLWLLALAAAAVLRIRRRRG